MIHFALRHFFNPFASVKMDLLNNYDTRSMGAQCLPFVLWLPRYVVNNLRYSTAGFLQRVRVR